jgi:hypothetical protein
MMDTIRVMHSCYNMDAVHSFALIECTSHGAAGCDSGTCAKRHLAARDPAVQNDDAGVRHLYVVTGLKLMNKVNVHVKG